MDLKRLLQDKQLQTKKQKDLLDQLKASHEAVAAFIMDNIADSAEVHKAAENLELARYWIIQAVARYPEHYQDES